MTDRERLIELIDEAVKERCLNIRCIDCNYYSSEPRFCRNESVVDHLIANGVTVQRWFPASDPPEEEGLYLVAVKNDHKRRYSKTAWYSKPAWFARQDVTHWMPLPEPKED